jgi:hypothetical protein
MFENAAIIGVGQSAYTRRPEPGRTALHFMRDAVVAALQDAGLDAKDIQHGGGVVFARAGSAGDLAWKLGLSLALAGAGHQRRLAGMSMLGNAGPHGRDWHR